MLGHWTYVFVGPLAYLETGAFIGLIAPARRRCWSAASSRARARSTLRADRDRVGGGVPGDLTSYVLGRRLGRGFLVQHGAA